MRKAIVLLALAMGCGQSEPSSSSPPSPQPDRSPARAIREADIIQINSGRLYALSRFGNASVIDVSFPGRLTLLGQTQLQGEPFEMYLRGGKFLVTMSNDEAAGEANVTVLDVTNPSAMTASTPFLIPGEIADSRIIGSVLYLVTYENKRTLVSTFDVSKLPALRAVDQVMFASTASDQYNAQWGQHWKRSIVATDTRMYIGGHTDIDPADHGSDEGVIDVLDITDRTGRLVRGARIIVAGALLSRWQLDERDGILRVISQRGAGRTSVGIGSPEVVTFRIDSTQSFVPLGEMTMRLPRQEGLRAVHFDGNRAYAITYAKTDPLFVIDLADPKAPRQRGELVMPGFQFHLMPQGDRVLGLGIDRLDPNGSLNISLFDVSNPDQPRMLSRAPFGPRVTDDAAILSELAEDQDRIQKAFRVLPNGLVVVPFNAFRSYGQPTSCENVGGGVQVIAWENDALTKRALLPLPGNPRRAIQRNGELLAISDSNVRSFSLDFMQTADLVVDTCVPFVDRDPDNGDNGGDDFGDDTQVAEPQMHCSTAGGAGWLVILAALFFVRRRRSMM